MDLRARRNSLKNSTSSHDPAGNRATSTMGQRTAYALSARQKWQTARAICHPPRMMMGPLCLCHTDLEPSIAYRGLCGEICGEVLRCAQDVQVVSGVGPGPSWGHWA